MGAWMAPLPPSQFILLLASAAWTLTMLACVLIVSLLGTSKRRSALTILLCADLATCVLWLAAFIVILVFIRGRPCSGGMCAAVKGSAGLAGIEV